MPPARLEPTTFRVLGIGRIFMKKAEMGTMVNGSNKVVVNDPKLLGEKKEAIRVAGPAKFQVIADFDNTLTKFWVNGCRGQSSHALLQQEDPKYNAKRDELFDYYHPIEYDPKIPTDEKTKLMEEWWGKTHGLLIEGGLTYDAIRNSVATGERDIPVLIFSAGLADIIEEVLRQKLHRTFKNVKIVSNRMKFDQNGNLLSFTGKLIDSLNKNEHALDMAASLHDHLGEVDEQMIDIASVKKGTNVLLLGDHIGDLRMNHNIENSLDSYRKGYDIVYLDDAPMTGVVKLVSELFPPASD
ncbi:7-methylguanosine phosphate-specific 5'-nucleotidase A [Tanacetum coccineum]